MFGVPKVDLNPSHKFNCFEINGKIKCWHVDDLISKITCYVLSWENCIFKLYPQKFRAERMKALHVNSIQFEWDKFELLLMLKPLVK